MISRIVQVMSLAIALAIAAPVASQSNRAEGFVKLPSGVKIALMPLDVELFEVSVGGVAEPRADWTTAALKHLNEVYRERKAKAGMQIVDMGDDASDEVAELNALHGAVGTAITVHHFGPLKLATKEGKLDWSLGSEANALRQRSGADYALFTFIRDNYASKERIAAMIVGALFGVGIHPGGIQTGYASLVDLQTGRIVWFNRLVRGSGDLRERDAARETLDALLADFPK